MTESTHGEGSFPDAAAREEFTDLADDVVRWRLTGQRWSLVADALERAGAAVEGGDADGFRRAVADVELLGPVRATRVGEDPTVPAPERVRELTNELVHRLDGTPGPTDDDRAAPPSR